MIEANALRKGTTFAQDNEIFKVLDYSHNKTARGGATIRVKVQNLRSGAIFKPAGERKVDDVDNDWMYPTLGDVVERWEPTGEPDVPEDELPESM